jgi:hypothetical protein
MKQADRGNKNVGLTLPPWAIDKLAAEAAYRGLTKSGLIQALLAGIETRLVAGLKVSVKKQDADQATLQRKYREDLAAVKPRRKRGKAT